MDTPTPIKNQATTEPGRSPPGYHNGTSTPHSQQEAVGRPLDTTMTMDGQSLLGHCPWLSSFRTGCWNALYGPHNPRLVSKGGTYYSSTLAGVTEGPWDDILIQQHQDLAPRLLAVDILRPPEKGPNDILEDEFYSTLCCAAVGGQLSFVGGGPNCRTWSILRWFPKPGAPRPVRGRDPSQTWGLDSNSLEEQLDTDKDSILLLRQLVITAIASKARQHKGFHSFLEHPRDPAECSRAPTAAKCSSVWATRVYQEWAKEVNHCQIHLDQCRLGQRAQKSTTFSTDLPIHHWQGLQCNHSEHLRPLAMTSRDPSRYPPALMAGQAAAIIQSIPNTGHPSTGCQQEGEPPGRTDRSSSVPLSQMMTLDDDPIIVQSGFKTRPLRDGGGKPSAGRRPPPLRPQSKIKHIGDSISHLAKGCAQDVQQSINRGERKHPFSKELLQETRRAIAQEIGLDHQLAEEMEPGQPFYLNLISALAEAGGDADAAYPTRVAKGVPLGVTTPTWTSPGIWPTKEELKGESPLWEDLLIPMGRDN